jgi:hypothetical protein
MRGLGICPLSEFARKSPMSSCRSVAESLSVYFLTSLAWVQSRGHTLICDSPLVMVVVMLHFSKSSPESTRRIRRWEGGRLLLSLAPTAEHVRPRSGVPR